MKIALIGCGNIGTEIASYIVSRSEFTLHSITDVNKTAAEQLIKKISPQTIVLTLENAIAEADLIIEAANKEVVKEILWDKNIDRKNKKLLVMSTGGLIENMVLLYKLKQCEIHVPSGAIGGLDAIQAVAGKINTLSVVTTKSPASLKDSPYIIENRINLEAIKTKTIIFKGKLKQAIAGFPKNINIAASLFLASKFEDIRIEIIADPATRFNTHKIKCKGKFGEINIKTINYPSNNPKTSYLAIQSAISVLNNFITTIKVGY